jgi:hypothetical protein
MTSPTTSYDPRPGWPAVIPLFVAVNAKGTYGNPDGGLTHFAPSQALGWAKILYE